MRGGQNRKDYSGMRGGRLLIIKPLDKRGTNNKIKWEALCDCGTTTIVYPCEVMNGHTKSCGCLRSETTLAKITAVNESGITRKYTPEISSARNVWRCTYSDCDFETFYRLSQLPCHYCGAMPHRTVNKAKFHEAGERQKREGFFTYNGLDRVDSSKGHSPDNVVPCCYPCNWMKSDMPVDKIH